ncbi:MAG: polysaccharide biosynthesis/export family protein [Nitrospira sp.]|nr:polysaccharide biosynthesis/export family protein [bacterium]MBL7047978.1 polysaccharide biosynthesis/export family protein [Nitrospira sp.]
MFYARLLIIVFILAGAGCAGSNPYSGLSPQLMVSAPATEEMKPSEYTLNYADVLAIKFFYNPELNELVKIRPDGKISLQLIGEVDAASLTPASLSQELSERYASILRKPEVSVIVQEIASSEVFVGGEVVLPGVITWQRGTSALRAVFSAGGFKETALPASVIVISRGVGNVPVAKKVNLTVMSEDLPHPENDIILKPYDIVFVPKSRIAEANKFVQQYIKNMIPGNLTGGFSYAIVNDDDNR